jgi:peptidoglycan/LPS O-acetylase OafA/YrhL
MTALGALQLSIPLIVTYAMILTLSKRRPHPRTIALCAVNVLAFLVGPTYLWSRLPPTVIWSVVWITMAAAIASIYVDTRKRPIRD